MIANAAPVACFYKVCEKHLLENFLIGDTTQYIKNLENNVGLRD